MKAYRKRFLWLVMGLIGAVLIIVIAGLGTYLFHHERQEFENLMVQVLKPLDPSGKEFRVLDAPFSPGEEPNDDRPFPGNDPEDGRPVPPEFSEDRDRRGGRRDPGIGDSGIVTAVYDTETGQLSVSSGSASFDEGVLLEAAESLSSEADGHGTLSSLGLTYYKETMDSSVKFAFAETSYLTSRLLRLVLFLLLAFLAAMAVIFFISLWLSLLAVKPVEEAMNRERQFVDDVSHDLKTPITVILANTSILKKSESGTDGDALQWLDSTENAAKNMMGMVNEMLTLSALESGRRTPERTETDLSSAVLKGLLQSESLAYEAGITVEQECAEDVRVLASTAVLDRIVGSLLDNAFKYEPAGGRVRVTLSTEKKKAVLKVRNFGSVIDEADLPHVFERFYRADKARNTATGHGLGLPILKETVASVGGEISAESTKEQGTVFTVLLDLV